MPDTKAFARLLLALAALLFSTGGAAIKAIPLSGYAVASLRSLIAAIAVFALLPAARRLKEHGILRLFLVGCAYAATLVLFVVANKLTTAANTIYLQSTAPIYLVLLAPLVLKERIQRADLVYMLALGSGLALFFVGQEAPRVSAPDPTRGNLLAAIAGVMWAFTLLGLRFLARGRLGTTSEGAAPAAVGIGNCIAFVATLPFALPLPSIEGSALLLLLYLGVFQVGLAYAFLTRGLSRVPALESSLILLLEPVLNPLWAFLFQGETPSRLAFLGCCIIFFATIARALADRGKREG